MGKQTSVQAYANRKADAMGLPRIDATGCINEYDVSERLMSPGHPTDTVTPCGAAAEAYGYHQAIILHSLKDLSDLSQKVMWHEALSLDPNQCQRVNAMTDSFMEQWTQRLEIVTCPNAQEIADRIDAVSLETCHQKVTKNTRSQSRALVQIKP